jgi:hypothetical protein
MHGSKISGCTLVMEFRQPSGFEKAKAMEGKITKYCAEGSAYCLRSELGEGLLEYRGRALGEDLRGVSVGD